MTLLTKPFKTGYVVVKVAMQIHFKVKSNCGAKNQILPTLVAQLNPGLMIILVGLKTVAELSEPMVIFVPLIIKKKLAMIMDLMVIMGHMVTMDLHQVVIMETMDPMESQNPKQVVNFVQQGKNLGYK